MAPSDRRSVRSRHAKPAGYDDSDYEGFEDDDLELSITNAAEYHNRSGLRSGGRYHPEVSSDTAAHLDNSARPKTSQVGHSLPSQPKPVSTQGHAHQPSAVASPNSSLQPPTSPISFDSPVRGTKRPFESVEAGPSVLADYGSKSLDRGTRAPDETISRPAKRQRQHPISGFFQGSIKSTTESAKQASINHQASSASPAPMQAKHKLTSESFNSSGAQAFQPASVQIVGQSANSSDSMGLTANVLAAGDPQPQYVTAYTNDLRLTDREKQRWRLGVMNGVKNSVITGQKGKK